MKRLGEFWRRLSCLFRRRQFEGDLEEEMRFHVDMKARANREAGLADQDARHAAKRQSGNATAAAAGHLGAAARRVFTAFRSMEALPYE